MLALKREIQYNYRLLKQGGDILWMNNKALSLKVRWVWKETGGGLDLASISKKKKLEVDGDDDDEVLVKVKG